MFVLCVSWIGTSCRPRVGLVRQFRAGSVQCSLIRVFKENVITNAGLYVHTPVQESWRRIVEEQMKSENHGINGNQSIVSIMFFRVFGELAPGDMVSHSRCCVCSGALSPPPMAQVTVF
jgi:hypothetical protein